MKRTILCFSALAFWLLTFSTVFSMRVEEWMVPSVTTIEPEFSFADNKGHAPLDCLFETESGDAVFTVYEGTMWDVGTRARALQPADYTVTPEDIQLTSDVVIEYATKTPRSGELVEVIINPERRTDRWLAVAEDGQLPEMGEPAKGIIVEDQTEGELLLYIEKIPQPFMEKRAQSMVPIVPVEDDFTMWTDDAGQVDWEAVDRETVEAARPKMPSFYSLTDLENWMAQMPKFGMLVGIIISTIVIWGFSCILMSDYKKAFRLLIINGALMLILLGVLPVLLHFIDLPSPLLPSTHIVDFGYYAREFGNIFGALQHFESQGSQAAAESVKRANAMLWVGGGLGAALIGITTWLCVIELNHFRKCGTIYRKNREYHANR